MRRRTPWIVAAVMMTAVTTGHTAENSWSSEGSYKTDLVITGLKIEAISGALADLKHGGELPQPALGQPGQLMDDAYTVPNGHYSEDYVFPGGSAAIIDHEISFCVFSPGVKNFALAWQPCGSGAVFPPMPDLLGTILDGNTIAFTAPAAGCYLLTVSVTGFSPGDWDWMVLADYDGGGPIAPLAPNLDTFGGSKVTYALYDGAGDPVGYGPSSARPWCFSVLP